MNEMQRFEGDILTLQRKKDELGENIAFIEEESKEKTDELLKRINDCETVREAIIRDHAKALRNKDKKDTFSKGGEWSTPRYNEFSDSGTQRSHP
jgi:uncharacterized protein YaaN involved in tellurite resistance